MTKETDIHNEFIRWLKDHQIPFIHHRTDRKSGIQKGMPDFAVFFMSRVVLIEVKSSVGRLRPDQVKMIEYIRRSGNKVEIARSVRECVEAVKSILCEGKRCTEPPGGCNYPLEECFKELKRAVEAVPVNGTKDLHRDGVCRVGAVSGGVESRHAFGGTARSPVSQVAGSDVSETNSELKATSGSSAPPAQNFFIGDWQGKPFVFAPDQDGAYRMIRQASAIDVATMPRLKDTET